MPLSSPIKTCTLNHRGASPRMVRRILRKSNPALARKLKDGGPFTVEDQRQLLAFKEQLDGHEHNRLANNKRQSYGR